MRHPCMTSSKASMSKVFSHISRAHSAGSVQRRGRGRSMPRTRHDKEDAFLHCKVKCSGKGLKKGSHRYILLCSLSFLQLSQQSRLPFWPFGHGQYELLNSCLGLVSQGLQSGGQYELGVGDSRGLYTLHTIPIFTKD
jgi:hypothetical protein